MIRLPRFLIIGFAYIVTTVSLVSAGPSDNILRYGIHVSAMGKLDPHFAAGSQDRIFADMVFNGLLRYVPGQAPRIEPDLAAAIPEFHMENSRQVWTVRLKKGVMFQAGPDTPSYELTADDVIFSLEKSADKETCAYAGGYAGMTFVKLDPYTIEITLENPMSPILFFPKLANYGGGFIVSKRAVETMGIDRFSAHPVGTGPFAFKQYLPGKKVELVAHKGYFRGTPRLSGVELHLVKKTEDRVDRLKKGDLDAIAGSSVKGWIEGIEAQPECLVDIHGVGEVASFYFNTRVPPLDDVRVRKAIAFALDRKEFLNAGNPRVGGAVYSQVPHRFLPGGLSENDVRILNLSYEQDLEKARQLLSDAGFPNGFSLDMVSSEKRFHITNTRVFKAQLERIGIRCNIRVVPHSEMHKIIRKDPKPVVFYGAWRPNADVYLTRFFHSDSMVVTGKKPDTNFSLYTDIDRLIEAARLEIDPNTQVNLWTQAQIKILDAMAAFPVMYVMQVTVRNRQVDYGHTLRSTMALYPQFTENSCFR